MADGRRVVTLARSPPARSGRGTPGCGLRGTTNTSSLVGIVVAGPSTGSGLAGFSGVCCGAPALLGGGYCSLLIPQRLIPAGLSLRVEHEQYGFYTQRVSLYAIVLPWQAVSSLTSYERSEFRGAASGGGGGGHRDQQEYGWSSGR
jgi:hypothetical protein